jgi:hypothetical protein
MSNCQHCGHPVDQSETGRPKLFCSDRCRKASSRVSGHEIPTWCNETDEEFPDSFASPDPAVDTLPAAEGAEEDSSPSSEFRWEQVNDVTWKLTAGEEINTPHSHGQWGGYRTSKAVAWVINLAPGAWLARYGDRACKPAPLSTAKAKALAMAKREIATSAFGSKADIDQPPLTNLDL